MSLRHILLGCVAALAVGSAQAAPSAESGPVGLVMSVTGKIVPDTQPYTEVLDDTRLDLGSSGKVTFVHYPSCRLVTVVGGKLLFSQQEVQLDGGAIESETAQKCPKQLKMKIAGVAGGVRMRAIPTAFLAERPACTLVGPRNRGFASARVMDGEEPVATVAMSGPQFIWPSDKPALTVNKMYRLELMARTPGEKGMSIDFAVSKEAPAGETECLLRVE